jgi:hypothetical protein
MVGALSYTQNECAHSEVNTAVSRSSIGCHTMQTPTLQHDWSTHNHCPLERIRAIDCRYKQIDSSEHQCPTPDLTAKLSIPEDTSSNTSSFAKNKNKKPLNCDFVMNYSNVTLFYIWPQLPSFNINKPTVCKNICRFNSLTRWASTSHLCVVTNVTEPLAV